MADEQKSWTEETARRWLFDTASGLRAFVARFKTVTWYEGAELPERYGALTSWPGECIEDGLAMRERYPELEIRAGYSFRAARPDEGTWHAFNLAPDGSVVDLRKWRSA